MAKLCLKKKSKRVPARLRYKIEKKVREHNRKLRKEKKKNPKKSGKPKLIRIPNECPFRESIIAEVEEMKKRKEEEKLMQRAIWKEEREKLKKLQTEGNLQNLSDKATLKQKVHEAFDESKKNKQDKPMFTKKEGSLKAYYREFKKVISAADLILEVVDARDPIGTRCKQVEEAVQEYNGKKRLVIVINKADLVPRDILEKWLKYLRGFFPTVPFKASTQNQSAHLGRRKIAKAKHRNASQSLKVSSCVGAELLMSLFGNYCRNRGIKTCITVGVVGLPNVGKSSVINSLKRSRACNVGATPGVTKTMQEVQLDSKVKLLDCPGLVFAGSTGTESDAAVALRNAIKVEALEDPFVAASTVLQRATKDQMMSMYDIADYNSPQEFFALKAKRQGKFKKGGVVDAEAAARGLIEDWNRGRIRYHTLPPEVEDNSHVSAAIVTEMSKEFDIEALAPMEMKMMDSFCDVPSKGTFIPFLIDSVNDVTEAMDDGRVLNQIAIETTTSKSLKRKRNKKNKGEAPTITNKEDKEGLPPTSNKKLQKKFAKKMRKESSRRERETTSLAGILENVSLTKGEDYSFDVDFNQ